jgi:D-3-phosphoglycerate dehydrogenase / 2-oxoglutarate reductase
MAHKNVLITDYVHPVMLTGLQSMGYETTYAPEMSRAEMEAVLPVYKGVVINTRCAINRETIMSSKKLKWIARLGSGLDIIDLEAAKESGISVYSAPEGNAEAVAEHAMGMLLCLSNKLLSADQTTRDGSWLRERHRGWEIAGKTVGIIGYGNNGSAFGRLWKGWNVRVLAYDKYVRGFGNEYVKETDLETLLKESDIISLHIPLTPETKEMINESFLAKCKPGCVLINTSRGKNVDLAALLKALHSGQLKGACLDVLPDEPPLKGPEDSQRLFLELCTLDQVVLSPHVAGWTIESKRKISEVLLVKIKSFSNLPQ